MRGFTLGALIVGVIVSKTAMMKLRASQVDISIELDGVLVHVGPSFGASEDKAAASSACGILENPEPCENAVVERIRKVRKVQIRHLSFDHSFVSLAVGMVSYTRIWTKSGSFPIFIHPAQSPGAALREFSLRYQPFISHQHLIDLSEKEKEVKSALSSLNSATLEVCYVVLPSTIIGVAFGFAIKNVQCVCVCILYAVKTTTGKEFIFSFRLNFRVRVYSYFFVSTEICFWCNHTHIKTYRHNEKRRTYGRVHVSRQQQQQQQQQRLLL